MYDHRAHRLKAYTENKKRSGPTDEGTESVCVCLGQSCSSGPDRPLSQLLPDLQLNQHGFSGVWYFSSTAKTNNGPKMARNCNRGKFGI